MKSPAATHRLLDQQAGAPGARFRLGKRPELDGLRGVAIVLVVAYHIEYFLVPSLAGRFIPGGFIAVDLFFALSGFLITTLLLDQIRSTGGLRLDLFYSRRAWRLLPALYLFLGVQFVYTLVEHDPAWPDLRAILPAVAYVGNWSADFHNPVPYALAQTWSLAIEEQFYLVWPLLLLGLTRLRPRTAIAVLVGIVVGAAGLRGVLFAIHVPSGMLYSQTEARLDDLTLGAGTAYALANGWQLPRRLGRWAVAALAVLVMVVATGRTTSAWLYEGGFTLIALCWTVVVLASLQGGLLARVLRWRPLRASGRYSYSLYLWHPLVFFGVSRQFPQAGWPLRVATAAVLLAVVSTLSFRFVEEPLRRHGARQR